MIRSPFFNFILGVTFGAIVGAAAAVHVLTVKTERYTAEIAAQLERVHQTIVKNEWENSLLLKRAEACEAGAGKLRADVDAAGKAAEMQKWSQDFRDSWYTLVYEPGAPAVPSDSFALLNMVRPGLGTLLAKLQAQSAPPAGMTLRYVLDGYVKSESMPAGVRLVYTRVPPGTAAETYGCTDGHGHSFPQRADGQCYIADAGVQ